MRFKFPILLCLISIGSSLGNVQLFNLNCNFESSEFATIGRQYTCVVQNDVNIFEPNLSIQDVTGEHADNKTIDSVTALTIESKNIEYLPNNIGEKFPNLIALRVKNGRLKELQQDDLKSMPNLKYLNLDNNDIEVLEAGVFENNPELKLVWLSGNKIRKIDENLADTLKNLISLDLTKNVCTNKKFALSNTEHASIPKYQVQIKFDTLNAIMQKCSNFTDAISEIDVAAKEEDHPDIKIYKEQIKTLNNQLYSTKSELTGIKLKLIEEGSEKNKTLEMLNKLKADQSRLSNDIDSHSIADLEIKLKEQEKIVKNLKDELKMLRGIHEEFSSIKNSIKIYEEEKYNFTVQIYQDQEYIRKLEAEIAALRDINKALKSCAPKTDTENEIGESLSTTTEDRPNTEANLLGEEDIEQIPTSSTTEGFNVTRPSFEDEYEENEIEDNATPMYDYYS